MEAQSKIDLFRRGKKLRYQRRNRKINQQIKERKRFNLS
jgi:hypothetical protein